MGAEVTTLTDISIRSMTYEIYEVIGARRADTKEGSWEGAYIACRSSVGTKAAFFENNVEYTPSPTFNWEQLVYQYTTFIAKGYKPMSRDDIKKPSGI